MNAAHWYRKCPTCGGSFGRGKGANGLARHLCDEPVVIALRKQNGELIWQFLNESAKAGRLRRQMPRYALLRQGATALFDVLERLALPGKGVNAWGCLTDREVLRVLKPFRKALNRIEGTKR